MNTSKYSRRKFLNAASGAASTRFVSPFITADVYLLAPDAVGQRMHHIGKRLTIKEAKALGKWQPVIT